MASSTLEIRLERLPAEIISMILEYFLLENISVNLNYLYPYREHELRLVGNLRFFDERSYDLSINDYRGTTYSDRFYLRGTNYPVLFQRGDNLRALATRAFLRANTFQIGNDDSEDTTLRFLEHIPQGFQTVQHLEFLDYKGVFPIQHPDKHQLLQRCENLKTLHFWSGVLEIDHRTPRSPSVLISDADAVRACLATEHSLKNSLFSNKGLLEVAHTVVDNVSRFSRQPLWRTEASHEDIALWSGRFLNEGFKLHGTNVLVKVHYDGKTWTNEPVREN